jgi:antirestriction protein ArdC
MNTYDQLTAQLVDMVDSATGEWSPPWRMSGLECHQNAKTLRRYQGMNVLMLWLTQMKHSYSYPVWATLKQWNSMGARVKKGSKGTAVVFYDQYRKQINGGEDEVSYSIAKTHYIYNADQVDGFELPQRPPLTSHDNLDDIEKFIKDTKADIRIQGERAFYVPSQDFIAMPDKGLFPHVEHYYSVMFHELTHWTGAKNRLDRELKGKGFRTDYAYEELVAELGAAFLSADFGIINAVKDDNAKYLKVWRDAMKQDSKIIFNAASQATKAVMYLHSQQYYTDLENQMTELAA